MTTPPATDRPIIHTRRPWRGVVLLCLICATLFASPAQAVVSTQQRSMLDMLDQLDQLDRMDLDETLSEAERCIIKRDFSCAKDKLTLAAQFAHNEETRQLIATGHHNLQNEIRQQRHEEEEQREMEQMREEQEEEEREARAEQRRRRQAAEDREADAQRAQNWNQWSNDFKAGLDRDLANINSSNKFARQYNDLQAKKRREQEAKNIRRENDQARQQAYEQKRIQIEKQEREQRERQRLKERELQTQENERENQRLARADQREKERRQDQQLKLKVSTLGTTIEADKPQGHVTTCYEIVGEWYDNGSGAHTKQFFSTKSTGDMIETGRRRKGTIHSFKQRNYVHLVNGKPTRHQYDYVVAKVKQDVPCVGGKTITDQFPDMQSLISVVNNTYRDKTFQGGSTLAQ